MSGGGSGPASAYTNIRAGFPGLGGELKHNGGEELVVWETACKAGGRDGGRVRVYAQSARPAAADPQSFPTPLCTYPWPGGAHYTPAAASRSRGTCWQPSATRKAAAGAGAAAAGAGAAAATTGATLQSRGSWRVVVIRTRTHATAADAHAHTRTGVVVYTAGDVHKRTPCTAIESDTPSISTAVTISER